jgi:hypothetical protein
MKLLAGTAFAAITVWIVTDVGVRVHHWLTPRPSPGAIGAHTPGIAEAEAEAEKAWQQCVRIFGDGQGERGLTPDGRAQCGTERGLAIKRVLEGGR